FIASAIYRRMLRTTHKSFISFSDKTLADERDSQRMRFPHTACVDAAHGSASLIAFPSAMDCLRR
ncbi:MAG: hypothetical protein ACREX1_13840, partial [Advenella sp.]